MTLCAFGPLTNIAMALVKAPEIAARIAELVVMGGGIFELGNVTPAAEFNIHVDPHAAALVFDSGLPITMVPLDVTQPVHSTPERLAPFAARQPLRPAVAALASFEESRGPSFGSRRWRCTTRASSPIWSRRRSLRSRMVNVAIETQSPLTLGMTVVDWWGVTGRPPNVRFLTRSMPTGFYALLTDMLAPP